MDNKQPPPYLPPVYDLADVTAMQALYAGEATPEQQKRALNWILYSACSVNDVEYRTNDRDHAFSSGRRFIGLQINKLIGINKLALTKTRS